MTAPRSVRTLRVFATPDGDVTMLPSPPRRRTTVSVRAFLVGVALAVAATVAFTLAMVSP